MDNTRNDIRELLSRHTDGREVYRPVYDEFFTEAFCQRVKRILEIGVQFGAGLEGWLRAFPAAGVYGLDIRNVVHRADPRLVVRTGDSTKKADVERFFASVGPVAMDVIVDDGDHEPANQLATLENFLPHVAPGGVYVLEDTGPRAQDDPFVREIREIVGERAGVFVRPVSNLAGVVVMKLR